MITKEDKIFITGASGFIGTNLVELFESNGYQFVNFDKAAPTKAQQSKYWQEGNIMDIEGLKNAMASYEPTIVIHLAAVTDTASDDLDYYIENTKGSDYVLEAVKCTPSIKLCVMTSTQYVYKDLWTPYPSRDDEYKPHTTYGVSKSMMEEATRHGNLTCAWTIVRPANVWGPWNLRYPNQLWKYLDMGLYFHPTKMPAVRTYAYVRNLVYQLNQIVNSDLSKIDKQTYYLGDRPISSKLWLEEWIRQLRGTKMHYIPSWIMACAAFTGDVLKKFGISFPIYSVRYHNMLEDYYAYTNKTVDAFGVRNESLADNVKETIDWVKGEGIDFFPYWKKKYGKK